VDVKVYDAAGRLVRQVVSGVQEPGYYTVHWDGCDDVGRAIPAGVYFVQMHAGDYTRTEKAVLLR
jgi:flagellar hook assembly protein FlgD